jgi:hypothetical protein
MQPWKREAFALRLDPKEQFSLDVINNVICIAIVNACKDIGAVLILGAL